MILREAFSACAAYAQEDEPKPGIPRPTPVRADLRTLARPGCLERYDTPPTRTATSTADPPPGRTYNRDRGAEPLGADRYLAESCRAAIVTALTTAA